jgi:protein-disulfide isomerase
MRRSTVILTIILALGTSLMAQHKATGGAKSAPVAKPSAPAPEKKAEAGEPMPTQATVQSFLKYMFSYDPNTTYSVLNISPSQSAGVAQVLISLKAPQGEQRGIFYVMPDQKYAIAGGELIPFGADPFAPARAQLAAGMNGISRGPANAPVTIVEFSDLECPACKAAQPTVERLIDDEPDVKFVFQNFPLEKLHPWALLGAKYAECVARQSNEDFWKFIHSVYQNQDSVTALLPTSAKSFEDAMNQGGPAISKKLEELAAGTGADPAKLSACVSEPATAETIQKSVALGNELDVNGTPTLFINGRRIQNVSGTPYDILKAMVDSAKTLAKE